ncbi:hypothetical protein [Streptomyces sp. NPDC059076]|uniref:hypothetical protein n=1 Tax=unclassified Streptomyces TaxID=2593676 RepID=UPI00367BC761
MSERGRHAAARTPAFPRTGRPPARVIAARGRVFGNDGARAAELGDGAGRDHIGCTRPAGTGPQESRGRPGWRDPDEGT